MSFESDLRTLIAELVREELARQRAAQDDYLDPASAGQIASVAPATIRRWVREGRLAGHHAGNRLRVLRSDLEQLLRVGPSEAKESPVQMARRLLRGVP